MARRSLWQDLIHNDDDGKYDDDDASSMMLNMMMTMMLNMMMTMMLNMMMIMIITSASKRDCHCQSVQCYSNPGVSFAKTLLLV